MRLTPADERALLRRIEEQATTSQDVLVVESLLDEAGNASLMAAIREMTQALTESATAESATSAELAVWRERFTPLLEAFAEEERRRNDNAARALDQSEREEAHRRDLKKIRVREILVPIVTAFVGGLSAWFAATLGG